MPRAQRERKRTNAVTWYAPVERGETDADAIRGGFSMSYDPDFVRSEWMRLRAAATGKHALEIAETIGVSECQLLATVCEQANEIAATRLSADWPAFLSRLPELGFVKTVTRNPHAVIEVEGTYDKVEFFGAMGQSVGTIDLRIFVSRWKYGFAVREETRRGVSRGLQFFDATGRAIHKVYLRDASDMSFYEKLVRDHTAEDQGTQQAVAPPEPAVSPRSDQQIDVAGLREAWLAMTDTHEFFGILRRFQVTRTQALRLIGEELARPVPAGSLEKMLQAVAGTDLPLMVFIGNAGIIQIHTGAIQRVVSKGPWINVLDPGFDMHVRGDRIESAWVVRKPTADGNVTALELYDGAGEQIALFVGKRKPGQQENDGWRTVVEGL
jgi:putative hemin transport protein